MKRKCLGSFSFIYCNTKSPMCVFQEQDYEVRTYHTTQWISTTVGGMDQEEALSTGFRKLFRYIQGNNEKRKLCILS